MKEKKNKESERRLRRRLLKEVESHRLLKRVAFLEQCLGTALAGSAKASTTDPGDGAVTPPLPRSEEAASTTRAANEPSCSAALVAGVPPTGPSADSRWVSVPASDGPHEPNPSTVGYYTVAGARHAQLVAENSVGTSASSVQSRSASATEGLPPMDCTRPSKFKRLIWTILLAMSCNAAEITCPGECTCRSAFDPNYGSEMRVTCNKGDMTSIPVEYIDHSSDIVVISAPPDKPNYLTIGPIFTQPIPFSNLKELHIVNSNIPSIGQYSFWGLQNLRLINLTHNNLTSIGADNFRGLINLTELHLDHNNIEQMPSETFRHLTALRTLILANNQITTLVPRLFRMLAKLLHLDLSYNPLADLNPEVFKDIQHLRIFKCRSCLLRRVNTQIYHLVPHLEDLDLGENQFKYLTSDEYISLKKLKRLRLDGNQLSVVVDNMFSKNRELRYLSLARNRLALLAPASLTNLTNLVHLDISHNKIDRFHLQTFAPAVDSLKNIYFSGNNLPLNEIAIVLQILPEIHSVGLANLSLEVVPPNFFTYNEHLISLDISWNKINKFPYKLLTKTKFLQRLDISRNKIQYLTEDDLQRLEAIAHVDLSRNHWRCDQCSVGPMLLYMSTTVLNATIRNLKCHSPIRLQGVSFAKLKDHKVEPCTTTHEAQMSVIAGVMLLCVAVLAAATAALCCSRRRAAQYYTNEEKRREHEHDHPEELLGRTEVSNVATINAPYTLVAKRS